MIGLGKSWSVFLPCMILSTAVPSLAQTAGLDDSEAVKIRQLYESGSYSSAELEGRRDLDQPGLNDSVRVQIEKYIAFSLIAQDRSAFAEPHFWNILQRDSSFALDPQLTSPKILNIFDKVRQNFFAARTSLPIAHPGASGRSEASFRTALFPGWEQLHDGRATSGYAFIAAGGVEVFGFIYCDVQRRSARNSYLSANTPSLAASRYTVYNRYYKGEIYSAAAFGITYLLSEVEVLTFQGDGDRYSGRISATADGPLLSLSFGF